MHRARQYSIVDLFCGAGGLASALSGRIVSGRCWELILDERVGPTFKRNHETNGIVQPSFQVIFGK